MRMQDVSPGLDADHVLTFRTSAQWSERIDAAVQRQKRTVDRLEAIPGVQSAAFSQLPPLSGDFPPGEFTILGRENAEKTFSQNRSVSAGYFRTLHIPVLEGATCSAEPPPELFSTKVLVTRTFADRFFPAESPIGHAVRTPGLPPTIKGEIIGIVADVRERGVLRGPEPLMYWCGFSPYWPDVTFLVRTDPARAVSAGVIRAALGEIEPNRAVYAIRPLTDAIARSLSQQRLNTVLIVLFAAMALVLAAMGLYGVLSQLVSSRRREIGVRMALGARPAHIVSSIVAQAAAVTALGTIVGIGGALALARFMTTLVFDIPARDPVTFAIVPLLLTIVAVGTALVPARRAARIDPMTSLRDS